jgi:hypothetical protein
VRSTVEEIAQLNSAIAQQNRVRYHDPMLEQLTGQIAEKLTALEE